MFEVHKSTLPPRLEIIGHGHPTAHLVLVERGEFELRTKLGWRRCSAGSLRLSPADAAHELRVGPHGLTAWVLELSTRRNSPVERFWQAAEHPSVAALWASLRQEQRWESECLSFELIASAARVGPDLAPGWLRRLRRQLDVEWEAPLDLRALSASTGRHPAHVARSFTHWYGRSIGEHLRARRLFEAERRLRQGEDSLVRIATDLGFNDQAHFTHAVRRRLGMTPARYRRLRRG